MKIGEVRFYVRLADGAYVAKDRNRTVSTRVLAFAFTTRSGAWAWIETTEWGVDAFIGARVVGVKRVASKTLAELRAAAVAYVEEEATLRAAEAAWRASHPEIANAPFDTRRANGYPDALAWVKAQTRLEDAARAYAKKISASKAAVELIATEARERIAKELNGSKIDHHNEALW
jgi:hypothetical protein